MMTRPFRDAEVLGQDVAGGVTDRVDRDVVASDVAYDALTSDCGDSERIEDLDIDRLTDALAQRGDAEWFLRCAT
jgi:hypothetical protein